MTETIPLPSGVPGTTHALPVRRFGTPGARPKVYVQAGLHADEVPGLLAIQHLCRLLAGQAVLGEIVVVPLANPIGLSQRVLGQAVGRFDLADGVNFNRRYPALGPAIADQVSGRLGPDAAANDAVIRAALRDAVAALPAQTPAEHQKRALLRLAADADLVLDLHCDGQAAMHLYGLTPQADALMPLARLLGAHAVLLATVSGDNPFDEACSGPWLDLRQRFPDHPIPLGCLATTVELRGAADVTHALAEQDAAALLAYLIHAGAVGGAAPPLPPALCAATDLAAVSVLEAPCGGIVVYRSAPGSQVTHGDPVAEVIDPVSGTTTPVPAGADGVLFALSTARFAAAGQRLGKIAGRHPSRTGLLLSP